MSEIFPESPLPVGSEPRTLDVVEDELTGVSLSLYEEELLTERLRWALASAKRGRARLRAQVAALLEERHSTNGALDDAVQELRADRIAVSDLCADCGHVEAAHAADAERPCDASGGRVRSCTCAWFMPREGLRLPSVAVDACPCPPADRPHQLGCPLDGVPGSSPDERPVNELTAVYMPVAALREVPSGETDPGRRAAWRMLDREERHDSPLRHDYRVGHDLPELGGAG